MINCPLCQSNFINRRTFALHSSRSHKFSNDLEKENFIVYTIFGKNLVDNTVSDYINEIYCISNLPVDISKYLKLLGVKRTSKEERKTDRYKNTYINSIRIKYSDESITNISQVKEVQDKKVKTYAKNYGTYDNYLEIQRIKLKESYDDVYLNSEKHIEAQKKMKNTCLNLYGNENFGLGSDAITKSKFTRRNTIASWEYEERLDRTAKARECVTHRGGYSSKPEKRIRKILIDMGIDCEYNKFIHKYSWDMLIKNTKILIEVQGTMWHAKPSIYNANDLIMGKILAQDIWNKDKRKRDKVESNGYKLIEIWEDEIKSKSDDELQILIKERLHEYEFLL